MLNKAQEYIYNTYLKNLRDGKPFQYRKNFSDLSIEIKSLLIKLEYFFQKYSHIKINEYFEAPNKLHPEEKYPYLNFFTTRAAIRTYSIYKKQKEEENPENQFEEIKESLRFIGMFCFKNKISLNQYLNFKNGYMYSWLNHYREHRINPYGLMELGNLNNVFSLLSEDEQDLYSNTLLNKIETFKVRYHNSPKTKEYVKTITKKIEDFLKKELHK
jgi:hypothetical protein